MRPIRARKSTAPAPVTIPMASASPHIVHRPSSGGSCSATAFAVLNDSCSASGAGSLRGGAISDPRSPSARTSAACRPQSGGQFACKNQLSGCLRPVPHRFQPCPDFPKNSFSTIPAWAQVRIAPAATTAGLAPLALSVPHSRPVACLLRARTGSADPYALAKEAAGCGRPRSPWPRIAKSAVRHLLLDLAAGSVEHALNIAGPDTDRWLATSERVHYKSKRCRRVVDRCRLPASSASARNRCTDGSGDKALP